MSSTYLVGLDGSEESLRAAAYAADHATHTGAKLILVHAIEWSGFDIMGPEELAERHKIREAELERAQEMIIQPALAAIGDKDVTVDSVLHHGHAAKTLLKMVDDYGATHVFIGRHGASRLEVAIIGSVANSIIQVSPVPVTVVP